MFIVLNMHPSPIVYSMDKNLPRVDNNFVAREDEVQERDSGTAGKIQHRIGAGQTLTLQLVRANHFRVSHF